MKKEGKLGMTIFILLILILLPNISCYGLSYYETWGSEKELAKSRDIPSSVIKFDITTTYRDKTLSNNQFQYSESITHIQIYLLDSTSKISLEELIFVSPTGYKKPLSLTDISEKSVVLGAKLYQVNNVDAFHPLTFNETGIWRVNIELNKTAHLFEYDGPLLDFNDRSKVMPLNYGAKGLEVLTSSAVQQLRSAKASERLLSWQVRATIVMIFTAIATASMAGFTLWNIEERRKEDKREGIKQMIVRAIMKEGIPQFRALKEDLDAIIGGYVTKPRYMLSSLRSDSYWKDFRQTNPETFDRICNFSKAVATYTKNWEECKSEIMEELKARRAKVPGLDKFLEDYVRKENISSSYVEFFEKILPLIATCILDQKCEAMNKYAKYIFEKFKKEFLEIRKKDYINAKIENLIQLAKEMRKYVELGKKLEKIKEKQIKKYNITHWEIDETYVRMLLE